jgi:hypothetical protein
MVPARTEDNQNFIFEKLPEEQYIIDSGFPIEFQIELAENSNSKECFFSFSVPILKVS